MICSNCRSIRVEWQGALSNLTHTLCLDCGAINSQLPDDVDDDESVAYKEDDYQELDFDGDLE